MTRMTRIYRWFSSEKRTNLHHEVLHEDAVGAAAAGNDVGQVGQLLDHDDAVVAGGLQQRRHAVAAQPGGHQQKERGKKHTL